VRLTAVLTAVIVKCAILQDVLPCSFMSTCRRFERTCCLRLQNEKNSELDEVLLTILSNLANIYYLLTIFRIYDTCLQHHKVWHTEKYDGQVDVFLFDFISTKNLLTYLLTYLFTYLLTYLLTLIPCSSVLHGKLTDSQLVKKFAAFYGIRSFITAATRVRHMSLSCDTWVPVTTAWRFFRMRMDERPSIWRVLANILNKQPRTADTGWFSGLGVGRGAKNSSP
jgi:hypothetical protein